MQTRATIITLTVLLALTVAATARSQTVQTMRFDANKTVFMSEIATAAGVENDGDEIRVLFATPEDDSVDLKKDDVVLMANGKRIRTIDDLRTIYESIAPGDELKLGIRRDERRFLVSFTRADPGSQGSAGSGHTTMIRMTGPAGDGPPPEVIPELGVMLSELDGAVVVAGRLQLPGTEALDIADGDRLIRLGDTPVTGLEQLMKQVDSMAVGSPLHFTVERDGEQHQVTATKKATAGTVVRKGP